MRSQIIIHPNICSSDTLSECSVNARYMFICMQMFLDKENMYIASYKKLKIEVFPGDENITVKEISQYIQELIHLGFIEEYYNEDIDKDFWYINGFNAIRVREAGAIFDIRDKDDFDGEL